MLEPNASKKVLSPATSTSPGLQIIISVKEKLPLADSRFVKYPPPKIPYSLRPLLFLMLAALIDKMPQCYVAIMSRIIVSHLTAEWGKAHQTRELSTRDEATQIVVFCCLCDQTSFMDLVDVFAVPAEQPPSDQRWIAQNQASAAHLGATDPWDSLGETDVLFPPFQ